MYVPKVKSLSSKTPDKTEEIMEQMLKQMDIDGDRE